MQAWFIAKRPTAFRIHWNYAGKDANAMRREVAQRLLAPAKGCSSGLLLGVSGEKLQKQEQEA